MQHTRDENNQVQKKMIARHQPCYQRKKETGSRSPLTPQVIDVYHDESQKVFNIFLRTNIHKTIIKTYNFEYGKLF